jgi:hypothetical protein
MLNFRHGVVIVSTFLTPLKKKKLITPFVFGTLSSTCLPFVAPQFLVGINSDLPRVALLFSPSPLIPPFHYTNSNHTTHCAGNKALGEIYDGYHSKHSTLSCLPYLNLLHTVLRATCRYFRAQLKYRSVVLQCERILFLAFYYYNTNGGYG